MARPPVFVLPHQPCYHPFTSTSRASTPGTPWWCWRAAIPRCCPSIVTFERRLSSDHRHDRLPILQRRLLLDDDQITLSDAIVDHRVSAHEPALHDSRASSGGNPCVMQFEDSMIDDGI